jgi:hypothetical protein
MIGIGGGFLCKNLGQSPSGYTLAQNYPNPFNPATTIDFSLPKSAHVTVEVYAITGQLVTTLVDREMERGRHSVRFDGSNLASGLYVYSIQANNFTFTRKMMLTK